MRIVDTAALGALPYDRQTTSKGNQPKWFDDRYWYKADCLGYESLAEALVSALLQQSNATEYVEICTYDPVRLICREKAVMGCRSRDFQNPGERLVSVERLHRKLRGEGMARTLLMFETTEDKIRYLADFVESATGLSGVGAYLAIMLQADAFFLNEDRHLNNIAFLQNVESGDWRLCPIFDNGLALLADTHDYPPEEDMFRHLKRIRAKPFAESFEDQALAAETEFGIRLEFRFGKKEVRTVLSGLEEMYPTAILNRVYDILCEQMRKYAYLFS